MEAAYRNPLCYFMSVIKPALQHPELIAYFSGANNYCWLFFRNGEKKLLAKPISYLESKLPSFIRVHKTVLINPTYIKSLHEPPRRKMAGTVCLDNGEVFPVSRRRWPQVVESLQSHQTTATIATHETGQEQPVNGAVSAHATELNDTLTLSILLYTDDSQHASLSEQLIKKRWSACHFSSVQQSAFLPDLLGPLSPEEHPALIILDARTATLERMRTLQRLKQDKNLSHIPVVLLVLPMDRSVSSGYEKQANSVISMPIGYPLFTQTIERICQFWMNTVTLPGAGR